MSITKTLYTGVAGQLYGLITLEALLAVDFAPFSDPVFGVAFQASDKINAFFTQLFIPLIVIITTITYYYTAFGEF